MTHAELDQEQIILEFIASEIHSTEFLDAFLKEFAKNQHLSANDLLLKVGSELYRKSLH